MNRINIILGAALLVVGFLYHDSCQKRIESESLNQSLQDTLRYTEDSLTAEISDIRVSKAKDFTKLEGLQGSLKELQELVKKDRAYNAAILKNISRIKGSSRTIILPGDTVREDGVLKIYPTYKTDWKERWSQGSITAMKDSIGWSFKVYNEFELSQSWKREKWFKKRVGTAKVTNRNPNTVTKEFRTFNLENKQNKFNFGPSVNLTYSLSDQSFKLSPGISLQYTLIGW